MQVSTALQTDNYASTPPLSFFTGRMPFLPPNQQHQSTEGKYLSKNKSNSRIFFLVCKSTTAFSALTLLVGHQEEHLACKKFE